MYSDVTYEDILDRMLEKLPLNTNKNEGSFIYDALAPTAIELNEMYIQLGIIGDKTSIDTATGEELTELCYQNGTFRKPATKAIRKGEFNIDVPIGTRFQADTTSYVVVSKIEDYAYRLECEQLGIVGNFYIGEITPVEYVEGLENATLTDVLVAGVEEETDEQLRERHKRRLNEGEQNGNISQYRDWAERFEGIGTVKVFPLWNGGNTVKVTITNRLYHPAEQELVDAFQEYLDPNSEGLGNGVAPIGSKVTVTGGVQKDINIAGNIILNEGYTEPEEVAENISKYLASITYSKNSVSYMRTAVAILDSPSVFDLRDFTINGTNEDVVLNDEEIPVLNSVNLTVVN